MNGQWALLFVLAAINLCAGSVAQSPEQAAFTLTNDSVASVLQHVATRNKEVIFTTFRVDGDKATLYMLRNIAYWLQRTGVLRHTLLITQDRPSWEAVLGEGLPCFLDLASPTDKDFPAGHRYQHRTFDFSKNHWALAFAELGYTSLYLDSDVVVLQDPFAQRLPPYDIQGLSDYRPDTALGPELPQLGDMLRWRCGLYRLKPGSQLEGGDLVHPAWELEGEEMQRSLRALAPCMSLGLWYMLPTPQSKAFLRYVTDWMRDTHQQQWDQAAWNEVLMGFLVGMGKQGPLRLRLLPLQQFANIEVWEARKQAGLAVDPVILHAGYLRGHKKVEKLQELGFWRPDDIDKAAARRHLQQLNTTLLHAAQSGIGSKGGDTGETQAHGLLSLGSTRAGAEWLVAGVAAAVLLMTRAVLRRNLPRRRRLIIKPLIALPVEGILV